ncbi:hypothetical protein EV421DRAFT_428650 [Armillaria borealis]|uniref:BZIP domain-containing protein n=1 Tax=Armillaria borealis TaxID=47425 RepID=A0AA39K4Z0_9AGAR|nr:hypothetical protein EV421DRAFT_428650 [Armillaria borealis]
MQWVPLFHKSPILRTCGMESWDYYPSPSSSSSSSSPSPMFKTANPEPTTITCLPTHQVFDFPLPSPSPPPASLSQIEETTADETPVSNKRTSPSPHSVTAKRPRERMTTRDFVPPDVSGLSKREARLVKNRAAAFLSRQRKREEFEAMEIRVAELELENARLQTLAGGASPPSPSPSMSTSSEIDDLRAQLAEAQALLQSSPQPEAIKAEPTETPLPSSSSSKSALMALLCALPLLQSLPISPSPATTTSPSSSALDVSFDAQTASNGAIRVRIHDPQPSSPAPAYPTYDDPFFGMGLDMGFDNDFLSPVTVPTTTSPVPSRRVRIALRSTEQAEGGEWEVQLC